MNFMDPVHLLLGYVDICAENGFAERFINSCTAEGIPLWDMRKHGDRIFAKTTLNGFKAIRRPARKSSMRVKLLAKHGLPFFIHRHSKKTGLFAGFAAMLVILAILSGRVWIINVDCENPIEAEQIMQVYESVGLTVGMNKRKTDIETVRLNAAAAFNDVSWTTVNITGSTATIKLRRSNKVPEPKAESGLSNIIASKDGQVVIIEPYSGKPALKEGQTVLKNGLLISGVTESKYLNNTFHKADGYVVASTEIKLNTSTNADVTKLVPEKRKVYSLFFLGKEIPLGIKKDSDYCYYHRSWLYLGGKRMPFGINYRLYCDFKPIRATLNEKELLLTAINDYALESYNKTIHAEIKSQKISAKKDKGKISVNGHYFCYENIGKSAELQVNESEPTEEETVH